MPLLAKNKKGGHTFASNRILFEIEGGPFRTSVSDFSLASSQWAVIHSPEIDIVAGTLNRFTYDSPGNISFERLAVAGDFSLTFEVGSKYDRSLTLKVSDTQGYFSIQVSKLSSSNDFIAITESDLAELDQTIWRVSEGGNAGIDGSSPDQVRLTKIGSELFLSVFVNDRWLTPNIANELGEVRRASFLPLEPSVNILGTLSVTSPRGSFSLASFEDPIVLLEVPQFDSSTFAHFNYEVNGTGTFYCSEMIEGLHVLSYLNNDFDLLVTSAVESVDLPVLVTSLVSNFETEDGRILVCQEQAEEGADNIGDIIVMSDCCFLDGSARDETPFLIVSDISGRLSQEVDRRESPRFLVENQGKKLGCNFDYQPIFTGEAIFSRQAIYSRQLELKDGRRFFYAATSNSTTLTQDIKVRVDLTHQSAAPPDLDPLVFLSGFFIQVKREDGSVLFESTRLRSPTFFIEETIIIPDGKFGRFYVEIDIFSSFEQGGDEFFFPPLPNSKAKVQIYVGTEIIEETEFVIKEDFLSGGKSYGYEGAYGLIDPARTEVPEQDTKRTPFIKRCYFELMPLEATIEVALYNPQNNQFVSYGLNKHVSLGTCLTRTRSVSAVELSNGHVAVFYRKKYDFLPSPYFDSYLVNEISYDVVNLTSGAIEYSGKVLFNSDMESTHSIYSFDIVQEGDKVAAYVSWRDMHLFPGKPTPDYPFICYPRQPATQNGLKYSSVTHANAFLGIEQRFNSYSDIGLKSFSDTQIRMNPDFVASYNNVNYNTKYPIAAAVRVNYNKATGLSVLSLIDNNSRQTMIMMGKSGRLKPVASPFWFDARSVGDMSMRIDSMSCDIFHDGMLIAVASRKTQMQLGVIDPSVFWSQGSLLDQDNPYTDDRVPNYSQVEFSQLLVPFNSDSTQNTPPHILDLKVFQHYSCILQSSEIPYPHAYGNDPLIAFQNSHFDDAPFEVLSGWQWLPSFFTGDQYYQSSSVWLGPGSDNKVSVLRNNSDDLVRLDITDNENNRRQHLRLGQGYRSKVRVRTTNSPIYTAPFVTSSVFCGSLVSSDLMDLVSPFVEGIFQFEILSDSVQPGYLNSSSVFVPIGDAIPIQPGDIYDLVIIAKKISTKKATAVWMVKRPSDANGLSYDFRNNLVGYSKGEVPLVNLTELTLDPFTFVLTKGSGLSATQVVEVFSTEIAILKSETGSFRTKSEDKGDIDPYVQVVSSPYRSELGYWRDFDDEKLLMYSGAPQYAFIAGYNSSSQSSYHFHFYNGFIFWFENNTAYPEDSWKVQRVVSNNPSNLLSKTLHGFWMSNEDGQSITISVIPEESGGPTRFDTIILSGCNFHKASLFINGADHPVVAIDTTYFFVEVESVTQQGDFYYLLLTHIIDTGRFSESLAYLQIGQGKPVKIIESVGSVLKVSSEELPLPGAARIFGGTAYIALNEIIEASTIDLFIPEQQTHEGYYQMSLADIGKKLNVWPDATGEGYFTESCVVDSSLLVGNQAYSQRQTLSQSKSAQLTYISQSLRLWMELTSLVENLSVSRIPVWLLRDIRMRKKQAHLCLVSGPSTYSPLLDDEGEESYQITIPLKAVE